MRNITVENAHEYAMRSVAARKAKREAIAERALNAEALANALAARLQNQPLNAKVVRIESQLARLDEMLDESADYKEINALTQAKERLLNAWALLTGFPRPGVRRQSKTRSTPQDITPLGPSSGPDTPSQSVPVPSPGPSTPQDTQEPNG
jgi:hypothetical protein